MRMSSHKTYDVAALDADGQPLQGDALLDYVHTLSGDTVFLQFSMGKDSICSWLRLREYGQFNIIPFFLYWFPNLSWQLEALDYYEDWFGQHIIRLPHPWFNDHLRNRLYQPPDRIAQILSLNLQKWDFGDIEDLLAADCDLTDPLPYTAVGFRGADNIDRRNLIIQKGAVGSGRRRYFFPIWEWNIKDIANCIKRHKVKLPQDYQYWGRTIGAWDYQYLKPIQEYFPTDYEQVVKFWMPLIDCELFRHEVVNAYVQD